MTWSHPVTNESMKKRTAYPLRKSSLFLLAVFLLPSLAKDVHYLFAHSHHDNHLHHCDAKGVHIHDPEHYTPENCSLCGVVYAQFFNNAVLPSLPVRDLFEADGEADYAQTHFLTAINITHPRGPPVFFL